MSLWKSGIGRMPQIFLLELKRALKLSLSLKKLNKLTKKSWPMRKKMPKKFIVWYDKRVKPIWWKPLYSSGKNSSQSSFSPSERQVISARLGLHGQCFGGSIGLCSPCPPHLLAPLLAESHRAGGDCVGHSFLLLWSYNSSLTHTGVQKLYCCIILCHFSFYSIWTKSQQTYRST